MATVAEIDPEVGAREVQASMRYVNEGDFVTRRYVSQGAEINTGTYSDHRVTVRDGMPIRDHFQLDTHGFLIGRNPTAAQHSGHEFKGTRPRSRSAHP